jgi:hypothetical protein
MQSLIGEKGNTYITSYRESNTFIFAEISFLKIPSCFITNCEVNY